MSLCKGDTSTQTHAKRECRMKMKAETGWCLSSQGMLKVASKPPEVRREAWNKFSFMVLGRTPWSWTSDLQNSWENTFLLFIPPSLWYSGSLSKLTENACPMRIWDFKTAPAVLQYIKRRRNPNWGRNWEVKELGKMMMVWYHESQELGESLKEGLVNCPACY